MTVSEFTESVKTIEELIDFCSLYGFDDITCDIRSVSDFDEWVYNGIAEERHRLYWHELRDYLVEMGEPGGEYFRETGYFEFQDVTDYDLPEYIDQVISAGYRCDFWDEEDDADDECESDWEEEAEDELQFITDTDAIVLYA